MSKPWIHSLSSVRKFGGEPEDYLPIHNLMDSSKATMADPRHRALTHNAWFIGYIIEQVFGSTLTNSAGKIISTREIAEQHVLEDFGGRFIPTVQDYLENMDHQPWMLNGRKGQPSSMKRLEKHNVNGSIQAESPGAKEPARGNAGHVIQLSGDRVTAHPK